MDILPDGKQFKILILSNAQFSPSGYGVQTNGMAYEWVKHYDVRVLANYGLQGRMLGLNGVQTYPTLPGDEHGNRTAELIFSQWNPDLFITLYDIWMQAYTRNTEQGLMPIHKHWIPICVSADTQINALDDDFVLGVNNNLEIQVSKVTHTHILPRFGDVYELTTDVDRSLKITAENPVWTSHGWKLAKDLNKGDLVSILKKDDIFERNSLGISGWIDRWRRKHTTNRFPIKKPQLSYSHSTSNSHNKSIGRVDELHSGNSIEWLSSEAPNKKQVFETPMLLDKMGELRQCEDDNRECSALFDNQEETSGADVRIFGSENKQRLQSENCSRRSANSDRNEKVESTEGIRKLRKINGEIKFVYDITTTSHNFFANGILIHNCMIDHEPIPEGTAQQCSAAFKCVVPLHYGVEQLARYGIEAEHIPLGIDTNVFKPSTDKKADKVWLSKRACPVNNQRQLPLDEDCFLILMNGANKDPYRKGFMRMFTALQMFLDQNPEARQKTRVYIHSWMRQARDLPHGAKVLGVDQFMKCTNDYHNLCGVPEDALARFYGAADVFFHLSEGGGFEIPVLEAMSAGVPVITTDFLCMKELVEDRGWLIPPIREGKAVSKYFTPLDATQCIANEEKAADALEDAWLHPEKRAKYAELGRNHALNFDWSLVNQKWIGLFEEIRASWRQKPLSERKL